MDYYVVFGSGGIVFWADRVGANQVYKSLRKWSEAYGSFYKPSKYLEERAIQGIPLVSTLSLFSSFFLFPLCTM